MAKTWLITGASRGIGAEITKHLLKTNNNIIATARDKNTIINQFGKSDRLLALELDVTVEAQIQKAIETSIHHFGRIDVLVNNAGYGHLGVFEESTSQDVRAEFNTNVFGLMDVTRAIIPFMRKQRSGHIFNISSIAGLKGSFGGTLYSSSKFAVEGFSQSLAEELAPFGIDVTCISPGFFRTDFLDKHSLKYMHRRLTDYDQVMDEFCSFLTNRSHKQLGDPEKLAEIIVKLAELKKPPVSFVAGSDAIEWVKTAIRQKEQEIEEWKELSLYTDGHWD